MSRENTSSVDMASGKKMAYFANQKKVAMNSGYRDEKDQGVQVVNAKKAKNLVSAKAKAKKKAKMVKASRKKNKK